MNKIILTVTLALFSSVALAKKAPPAQNHSCVLAGAVVEKTKKQCLKAGGKWEKNAPAGAEAAPAPAAAAAPAPAATPAPAPADAKPAEAPAK